jgi:hypothetical protein
MDNKRNKNMKENKELLYEKLTSISELKDKVLQENEILKVQIAEANSKIEIFEKKEEIDLVGKLTKLIESISIDDKGEIQIDESLFNKTPETLMAKYFVKAITDKAKEKGLDAKKIAEEILSRIK